MALDISPTWGKKQTGAKVIITCPHPSQMHRFIRHNLHGHFAGKWRLYPCDWEKLWTEAVEGWCCRLEELRSRMRSGWTAGGWKTMSWAGWRSLLQSVLPAIRCEFTAYPRQHLSWCVREKIDWGNAVQELDGFTTKRHKLFPKSFVVTCCLFIQVVSHYGCELLRFDHFALTTFYICSASGILKTTDN